MNRETKDWLAALERERHDNTWRKPQERPFKHQPILPPMEKKETKKQRQQRDQDFFDAGRYKAGDRDIQAKLAWNRVTRGKVIAETQS